MKAKHMQENMVGATTIKGLEASGSNAHSLSGRGTHPAQR